MTNETVLFLDPFVMYKEDLLEYEALINKEILGQDSPVVTTIKVVDHSGTESSASAIDELLNQQLLEQVSHMTITSQVLDSAGTESKQIHLEVEPGMARIVLRDPENKAWVKTAEKQLKDFFREKRPWYGSFKKTLAPLFNISLVISLFLMYPAFSSEKYDAMFLPIIMILYFMLILIFSLKQKIFPYTRINLFERDSIQRKNTELTLSVTGLIIIIVTVAASISFF